MEGGPRLLWGPRAWLSALLVLAALLATGAVAATTPSEQREEPRESVSGEVVRLTDGADVEALEAPAGEEPAETAEVEGAVEVAFRGRDRVPVIVRLREQADLPEVAARARAAGRARGHAARVGEVVRALRDTADRTQHGVRGLLRAEESAGRARNVRSYWIFNGFAATVGRAALDRLARHPDVESIELDEELSLPETESEPRLPTWGLEKVNAPRTWGITASPGGASWWASWTPAWTAGTPPWRARSADATATSTRAGTRLPARTTPCPATATATAPT